MLSEGHLGLLRTGLVIIYIRDGLRGGSKRPAVPNNQDSAEAQRGQHQDCGAVPWWCESGRLQSGGRTTRTHDFSSMAMRWGFGKEATWRSDADRRPSCAASPAVGDRTPWIAMRCQVMRYAMADPYLSSFKCSRRAGITSYV